jgi:hypothetical protein
MVGTDWTAQDIDEVLAETFPASDPPAWTTGIASLAPQRTMDAADTAPPAADAREVRGSSTVDVSGSTDSATAGIRSAWPFEIRLAIPRRMPGRPGSQ